MGKSSKMIDYSKRFEEIVGLSLVAGKAGLAVREAQTVGDPPPFPPPFPLDVPIKLLQSAEQCVSGYKNLYISSQCVLDESQRTESYRNDNENEFKCFAVNFLAQTSQLKFTLDL